MCRDVSALSGGISVKLATGIRHISGHYSKVFKVRDQKSRSHLGEMHFSSDGIPVNLQLYVHCQSSSGIYSDDVVLRLSCFR